MKGTGGIKPRHQNQRYHREQGHQQAKEAQQAQQALQAKEAKEAKEAQQTQRGKRFVWLFFAFLCFASAAYGQQAMFFSQYILDPMVFNPAYAGAKEALTLTAQYRMQWVQVENAPVLQSFSAHTPLENQRIGLGLRISKDQIPGFDQQQLSPVFSYRIELAENRMLSAGLQTSLLRQKAGLGNVPLRDPDDPAFRTSPAALSLSFGTGLFYSSRRFYAGMAVPALFPDAGGRLKEEGFREEIRSYILHTGYVLDLNPEIKMKPNLLLNIPERGPAYVDLNLNLLLRDVLWVGGSFRLQQGLAFLTQLQLSPQLTLAYSYDIALHRESHLGMSSHEASLQYRFYFVKSGIKSPRFF